MNTIQNYITGINAAGSKALAVFLTAGFPDTNSYVDIACGMLDAGADILEIGIPFSDPLADGPVIQNASQIALDNGVDFQQVFAFCNAIRQRSDKKIVAMGYANPILSYGVERFFTDAAQAGFNGLIVPDVPLDEYENFYGKAPKELEVILLITPVTTPSRISMIDGKSRGFLYYVSVAGTTGAHQWDDAVLAGLKKVRSLYLQNKLMVGFGVASPEDIVKIKPYCDGVIVGSAIIKQLQQEPGNIAKIEQFVSSLKSACNSTL